jgi:alkanesulfonate monooxygenase SsuD/methylene tetrahydromethanopterin reductase-like flavin-dependent oxidoreductase (luciferase family)
MITKFDSSYYGTADMENLGYLGTPINERFYPQEQFAKALRKVVAYAKCMDERGFNTFWMAEHHFQPEGTELIPNLLMMAMHLVNNTKNLKIGCGFNVVPMWHPLRLAEDYAMADILSGGRVIFGVARGYHTREVETFGSPLIDQEANREKFEEGVEIVFKAFEGKPFSHKGKFYTIPPEVPYRGYTLKEITLVPAPERLPVECWQPIQSGSDRAFDFMSSAAARPRAARSISTCSGSRPPTRGAASNWNSASGWRSASSSTSRRVAKLPCARRRNTTKRT